MPASSGIRRPTASESGPTSSCPNASPTSVPVSVSCTAAALACRSVVIVGSDGRYMSIVSGPSAVRKPSTRTIRKRRPIGSSSPGERSLSGGVTVRGYSHYFDKVPRARLCSTTAELVTAVTASLR